MFLIFLTLIQSAFLYADQSGPQVLNASRCTSRSNPEPLYSSDVRTPFLNVSDLYDFGQQVYILNKRLADHFYYSPDQNGYIYQEMQREGSQPIVIPNHFIRTIAKHMKSILDRNYARSLYMSDLGHGHFMLPDAEIERLRNLDLDRDQSRLFVISHPDLKVLYHSAEYLNKVDENYQRLTDQETNHYIAHRNILGDFSTGEIEVLSDDGSNYNTQSRVEGYSRYWTVDFSWNQNGCVFIDHGDGLYLDLTFTSIGQDPDAPHTDE